MAFLISACLTDFPLTLLWLWVVLSLTVPYFTHVFPHCCRPSHMHTCSYRLLNLGLKGSWSMSWKHMGKEFGEMIKDDDILTVLRFKLLLIYTHPSPSSLSPPIFSPPPLLCDDMYVLMETRCALLRWKRRRERKTKHEVEWYFINRLQEMWGGRIIGGRESSDSDCIYI